MPITPSNASGPSSLVRRKIVDTWQALAAQTAVNDGSWVETWLYSRLSFDIRGLASGDIVQVRGGNNVGGGPADSNHMDPMGTDITADGLVAVVNPPRWTKVRKSAAGGTPGAVNCYAIGVR